MSGFYNEDRAVSWLPNKSIASAKRYGKYMAPFQSDENYGFYPMVENRLTSKAANGKMFHTPVAVGLWALTVFVPDLNDEDTVYFSLRDGIMPDPSIKGTHSAKHDNILKNLYDSKVYLRMLSFVMLWNWTDRLDEDEVDRKIEIERKFKESVNRFNVLIDQEMDCIVSMYPVTVHFNPHAMFENWGTWIHECEDHERYTLDLSTQAKTTVDKQGYITAYDKLGDKYASLYRLTYMYKKYPALAPCNLHTDPLNVMHIFLPEDVDIDELKAALRNTNHIENREYLFRVLYGDNFYGCKAVVEDFLEHLTDSEYEVEFVSLEEVQVEGEVFITEDIWELGYDLLVEQVEDKYRDRKMWDAEDINLYGNSILLGSVTTGADKCVVPDDIRGVIVNE